MRVHPVNDRARCCGSGLSHPLPHGMCHGCAIGTTRDGIEKLMTPGLTCGNVRIAFMERVTRVELAFSAWEIDLARFADLRFC